MARFARHFQWVFTFGIVLFANEHQRKPPVFISDFLLTFCPYCRLKIVHRRVITASHLYGLPSLSSALG